MLLDVVFKYSSTNLLKKIYKESHDIMAQRVIGKNCLAEEIVTERISGLWNRFLCSHLRGRTSSR